MLSAIESDRWSNGLLSMPGTLERGSPAQFVGVALSVGLLHIAAAVAVLHVTARRFDRLVGRAKG
jgi:hypothetical protein